MVCERTVARRRGAQEGEQGLRRRHSLFDDIEVDPQRRRFRRREFDFALQSLIDRRPNGENGTCPSCVAISRAVKCALHAEQY
jgi:hypothetical protein